MGVVGRTAYNRRDVSTFLSSRMRLALVAGSVLVAVLTCAAAAQPAAPAAALAEDRGKILLVLPFDNRSTQPSLEWVREAAADLLSRRFASAGFAPMSRVDRIYALDHLGLPQGFHPSRASALKMAQTLDADSIVVGSYQTDGAEIVAEARLVNVPALRMGEAATARGPMAKMADVFDSLAWKLTLQMNPTFGVPEETFLAAGREMRLNAYEQYIRGIIEPDQTERLRHLQKSVELDPRFGAAWMALGREQYVSQQYEQAAKSFSLVGRNDPEALEAGFYRGLALVFSGSYREAEKSFEGVARILPLAEVLNNQAVAVSRQGNDATDLFVKAVAADPASADYHFNLAVSLKRHGQTAAALNELAQCLKLRPIDVEAQSLETAWKQSGSPAALAEPLERIVRSFDAAAFRQAAGVMDQMDSAKLAALAPRERARKLSEQASEFLDRGLILEAERLYRDAVAADAGSAEAHAGLAAVREHSGDAEAARREARESLELRPTAAAWLVIAKLDMAAGKPNDAVRDTDEALKLEPVNPAVRQLRAQILARPDMKR